MEKPTAHIVVAMRQRVTANNDEKMVSSVDELRRSVLSMPLLNAALHGTADVRRASSTALAFTVQAAPRVLTSYVSTLLDIVGQLPGERRPKSSSNNDDDDDSGASVARHSIGGALRAAVDAARGAKLAVPSRVVARLALLLSHSAALPPSVRAGVRAPGHRRELSGAAVGWRYLSSRIGHPPLDASLLLATLRTKLELVDDDSQLSNRQRAARLCDAAWRDAAADSFCVLALAEHATPEFDLVCSLLFVDSVCNIGFLISFVA
jgi:hypothetical protein